MMDLVKDKNIFLHKIKLNHFFHIITMIFILIVKHEFYIKIEEEKKKISENTFEPYKHLLTCVAENYELDNGFKNINNYNEAIYINFRLPELINEYKNFNNKMGKYLNNKNNRFSSKSELNYIKIKWYKQINKSLKYFPLMQSISHAIPNIGMCSIIKLNENENLTINKLNLYLVNSLIVILNGSLLVKKNDDEINLGYSKNIIDKSTVVLINDNLNISTKKGCNFIYIEFMGHTTSINVKFTSELYSYFINFL
jgi:hypothetical protein